MPIIFIPVSESPDASTSLTTFSQLYSSALTVELANEDSTRLFTDQRRKNAINDGVEQFSDLTECFTRQSTVTSSHGVGEYNLLSTVNVPGGDFWRLSKQRPEYRLLSSGSTQTVVTYASGESFERRDVEWLNQYEPGWRSCTAGTPRYYYERLDGGRRVFGLYPPPQIGSSQSAEVILPYVAKPQIMTSDTDVPWRVVGGSSPGIRSDLHVFLQGPIEYATSQLEKLRGDLESSERHLQKFLGWVSRYVASVRPKGGTTVKHARSYFGEQRQKSRGMDDLPRPMNGWNWGG